MELNEFSLFATYDQCKIISEKHPDIKTVFCWYECNRGYISGIDFIIGKSLFYRVDTVGRYEKGVNFGATMSVRNIVPAYTYQELLGYFKVNAASMTAQDYAEVIITTFK
jgi:hypothetical protein